MATHIHPTAIVSPEAHLGENVRVGAYAIIDPHVVIGAECIVDSHVRVCEYTQLGCGNHLHHGAVLGEVPQDAKFQGEESRLIVGDNNQIREYSTFHRASGEGAATVVGSNGLYMAYSHVGHNVQVGDNVLIASFSGVSGHSIVEDHVNIAGFVGIHQYVMIGTMAMVGGMSRVVVDIPPFCMAQGNPSELHGLNYRGLIRHAVSDKTRSALKKTYRALYRSTLTFDEAVAQIRAEVEMFPEVERLLSFQAAVAEGYAGRQRDPYGKKK